MHLPLLDSSYQWSHKAFDPCLASLPRQHGLEDRSRCSVCQSFSPFIRQDHMLLCGWTDSVDPLVGIRVLLPVFGSCESHLCARVCVAVCFPFSSEPGQVVTVCSFLTVFPSCFLL